MKYLKSFTLLLLIYIAAPKISYAQFEISEIPEGFPTRHSMWVDGGVGYSTLGEGAIANITYQPIDSFIVSIGAAGSWDLGTKVVQSREYYATGGLVFKGKKSVASFELGPSFGYYYTTQPDPTTFTIITTETKNIGLAIQGKFFWTPIKYCGIGIQIFADINGHQTAGQIALFLALRKLPCEETAGDDVGAAGAELRPDHGLPAGRHPRELRRA